MLVWDEEYKIGHEEMDAQHLILFALLNQLTINIDGGRGGDCLRDALAALGAYIDYHFAHEEQLMKEWGFPDLEEHAESHRQLIAEMKQLQDRLAGFDLNKAAMKVRVFVLDWLLGHILGSDREYARFIAARQGSAPS